MSSLETKSKKLRNFFAAGAAVIIFSLILWVIPSIMVGGFEARIIDLESRSSLSSSESNLLTNLRYSRNWWQIIQATAIDPIATVIFVIGLFIFAYCFIVRFL